MPAHVHVLYIGTEERARTFLGMVNEAGLPWRLTAADRVHASERLRNARVDVIVIADGGDDTEDFAPLVADAADATIILITTPDREAFALAALERGADDYVVTSEPNEWLAVRAAVEKGLRRRAALEKGRRPAHDGRDSEQQWRAVFENAASGIILTDGNDRLVAVNQRLCEMLGYSREQLLGMSVRELTFEDDRARSDDLNARIHDGPVTPEQYEKRYIRCDGSPLWVDVSVSSVRDAAGRHLYSVATVIDISARKAAEGQLRLQAAALSAAPNAISLSKTDESGTIIWVNEAFTKLTGYSADEAIGQTHHVLSSGEQDEAFYRRLWETIGRGEVWRGELVNRRKDGTLYHEEMGITPLLDEAGRITHFVAIKQDITRRKEIEAALAAAKQAAEEASHAKDRFLAVLSHELRTPLAPVAAALALLQRDSSLSDRALHQLAVMRRNVERESRLIDDLLDITRIARGRIELDRKPVDLRAILDRAIEVCRPDIEARHLHFGVDADSGRYPLRADARRLEQVFWNLLQNSIKFTPNGGCVGLRCRQRGGDQVTVEVSDSGMGIEPGAVEHLFDAFAKGADSRSRRFGGLGLGLSICKAFVEMHGGTITASSDGPEKGATLTVALPLSGVGAHDVPPTGAASTPQAPAPPRSLQILLVEDHGDTAEMTKLLLEQHGHRVEAAADVATALALVSTRAFDLLLSDLGLPDRSGLELVRAIRACGKRLPAVALSGYGQELDIEQSRQAGFDAHLVKPVDPVRLQETISEVVGAQR